MTKAEEVFREDPTAVIAEAVKNNTEAIAVNLTRDGMNKMTQTGVHNTLMMLWDQGKEAEVWSYIDVPFMPDEAPDDLVSFWEQYAVEGESLVKAYQNMMNPKKESTSKGDERATEQNVSTAPVPANISAPTVAMAIVFIVIIINLLSK